MGLIRDALVVAGAGLTLYLFARILGYSPRAVSGWVNGEAVGPAAQRRVREIQRFRERLTRVVSPEHVPAWLETPNPAFDGLKPVEVIERGEIDRLWDMIFFLESGVAS